jgi:glucoamylase
MSTNNKIRAHVGAGPEPIQKPSLSTNTDLSVIAQHMYVLMMRNVTSDGYVLNDPTNGTPSSPGCVIAAPSYPRHTPGVDQDYVFNWVRDAAIAAMELAAAQVPDAHVGGSQALLDYVAFARLCQENAQPTLGHACFTVDGRPRPWTEQSDGPALQTLAVMSAYNRLDPPTKAVADALIRVNLGYLLAEYQQPTTNLWEEHSGLSFFARSVQLRCFKEIAANTLGIPVPAGVDAAVAWLTDALARHWNGTWYVSMLAPPAPGDAGQPALPASAGYDPNIDIVCACIYGAVEPTDSKLLASAARLRSQWADPASPVFYPINGDDKGRGLGPLLGRYPGDTYDGDMQDSQRGDHPWALCTCNLAELYYRVAKAIDFGAPVQFDNAVSRDFFDQVGVAVDAPADQAASALRAAGDRMLRAVIFHSDHLELSEQFDGFTGYEKSVTNLTWSYAAFLSAVRARTGQAVAG